MWPGRAGRAPAPGDARCYRDAAFLWPLERLAYRSSTAFSHMNDHEGGAEQIVGGDKLNRHGNERVDPERVPEIHVVGHHDERRLQAFHTLRAKRFQAIAPFQEAEHDGAHQRHDERVGPQQPSSFHDPASARSMESISAYMLRMNGGTAGLVDAEGR